MNELVEALRWIASQPASGAIQCRATEALAAHEAQQAESDPVAFTHAGHIKALQERREGYIGRADYLVGYFERRERWEGYDVPLFTRPPAAIPEWQPIETAPKDGAYVLVTNGGGAWVARFKDVFQSGWKPPCPWQSMMLNHDHIAYAKRKGPPTHWMPLPAAPKP